MGPEDRLRSQPILTRRGFIQGTAAVAAAAALAACGTGKPTPEPTPTRWVRVSTTGMTAGNAAWIRIPNGADGIPQAVAPSAPPTTESGCWLVAQPGGTFLAFDPRCTHKRCLFDWDAANVRFACRCHGGHFGPDGHVIDGPPPRPLNRYQVRSVGVGVLEIGWWDPGTLEPEPT